jgi:hypothetical protein
LQDERLEGGASAADLKSLVGDNAPMCKIGVARSVVAGHRVGVADGNVEVGLRSLTGDQQTRCAPRNAEPAVDCIYGRVLAPWLRLVEQRHLDEKVPANFFRVHDELIRADLDRLALRLHLELSDGRPTRR